MKHRPLLIAVAVVALAGGAALRLGRRGNRPMHPDEAVQAFKFARLLETNEYVYDPQEYHGPAPHYCAWPIVRLVADAPVLQQVEESDLRLVTALFGIALIALVWLLRGDLGSSRAAWASAFTAFSPALVFYSRYYISETLLVFFSFGAIVGFWRYLRSMGHPAEMAEPAVGPAPWSRGAGWLALAGFSVGMMHATKETSVIVLLAMAVAAGLTLLWSLAEGRPMGKDRWWQTGKGFAAALVLAALLSALLFSSFLSNPRGPWDSIVTYLNYAFRASGRGDASWHLHPWHYYLRIVLWWGKPGEGFWTHLPVVALAAIGFALGSRRDGPTRSGAPLVRFLGLYTLALMVMYSLIPYKTPWCIIGAVHGTVLLAGVGAAGLLRMTPGRGTRIAAAAAVLVALGYMGWQAWRDSFTEYENPASPYVYAQATSDVPLLARRLRELAVVHPRGSGMHVQVICPGNDYWPLPWYLRDFDAVGWHNSVPDGKPAPVILLKPAVEAELIEALYERRPPGERTLYVDFLRAMPGGKTELRPNVFLRAYVEANLWQAFEASRSKENGSSEDQGP